MMTKKTGGLLVALLGVVLVLAVGLVPGTIRTAYAEDYPLWVGGTQVTSENSSGDGWSYTPAQGESPATLTLNGANISGGSSNTSSYAAIYATGDLTINVTGDSTVTGPTNNELLGASYGILSGGSLTIGGYAKLTIDSTGSLRSYGIQANKNLTISGGSVNATGGYEGIRANKNLTISGGSVEANGGVFGIDSHDGNIAISSGSVIAEGGTAGINALSGSITISDGSVDATGDNVGISTFNQKITIDGGSVKATGLSLTISGGSMGITTASGDIEIKGGSVVASGAARGIDTKGAYGGGAVKITGGTVIASGGTIGIDTGSVSVGEGLGVAAGDSEAEAADVGDATAVATWAATHADKWVHIEAPVPYGLWVNNVRVTNLNRHNVLPSDPNNGKVSFTPASEGENATPATLTLSGATITQAYTYADEDTYGSVTAGIVYAGEQSLVINLSRNTDNSVIFSDANSNGIFSKNADLTIAGEGTLVAEGVYGIAAPSLTISSGRLTAAGPVVGIAGTVKNAIAGMGWTNKEGTTGRANIAVSDTGQSLESYKKVQFPAMYPLWVGGTQVTALNASNITGGETVTASYDAETSTLTLNGAVINDKGTIGDTENTANIHSAGINLTIALNGDNTVGNSTGPATYAIDVAEGNLTINGTGSLVAHGSGNAIATSGDMSVTGGSVEAISDGTGDSAVGVSAASVTVGNTITSFTAAGSAGAFNSSTSVKNAIAGTGWSNADGAGDKANIAESTTGQNLSGYKNVQFPALYPLWVGNVQVTSANAADILAGDPENKGKVSFTPGVLPTSGSVIPATLTLKGANISATHTVEGQDRNFTCGIYYAGERELPLEIILESGTASTIDADSNASYGIHAMTVHGVTISGKGSLDVGGSDAGVKAYALKIASGTVSATGVYGIHTSNGTDIKTGASVTATGTTCAVNGPVENADPGAGWKNVEGTGDATNINPITGSPDQDLPGYKKVQFPCTVYPLWVGNVQVTSANAADILAGDPTNKGKVSFTPADTTTNPITPAKLTLSGANITKKHAVEGQDVMFTCGIYYAGDQPLEINVPSDTASEVVASDSAIYGIHARAQDGVTITGGGTLNVGGCEVGIDAYVLGINGGTVSMAGRSLGITCASNVTIGAGTVTATGSNIGISCGNATINGGTVVASGAYGIYTSGGTSIATGASVTATGTTCAVNGPVENADPGAGWKNVDGTGDATGLVANVGTIGSELKKAQFPCTVYPLWVGGVQVTSANAADILAGDPTNKGKVSFTPAEDGKSGTLMLNGAAISGKSTMGSAENTANIRSMGIDLTIVANGENTVGGQDLATYAIEVDGGYLAIGGTGSLAAHGKNSAIRVGTGKDLEIRSGQVSATSDNAEAIVVSGHMSVAGGSVQAVSGGTGGSAVGVSTASVTVGAKVASFTAAGNAGAFAGNTVVKNGITGTGWTDKDGTRGRADIAISGGQKLNKYRKVQFPAAKPEPGPEPTPVPTKTSVTYTAHTQTYGWRAPSGKDGTTAGTTGEAKRLEAITAKVDGATIEYRSHLQKDGWEKTWAKNGDQSGTTGIAKRIEAIQMRVSGAEGQHVWYRVHSQTYGWLGWARDGMPAGTTGQAKRAEAFEVLVLGEGQVPDGYDATRPAYIGYASGDPHVQTYGWLGLKSGGMFGTTGQRKRLEALRLSIPGQPFDGGVEYQLHLQGSGWEKDWAKDGAQAGTTGEYRRAEAVRIRLAPGSGMAENMSLWYRVHSQTYGWLGWTCDGKEAGTTGLAKRAEAVEVQILPKGAVPLGYDAGKAAFRS